MLNFCDKFRVKDFRIIPLNKDSSMKDIKNARRVEDSRSLRRGMRERWMESWGEKKRI